jgi:translin
MVLKHTMNNLDNIIKKIDKHINEKDQIREQALRTSREVIINCRKAIQALHRTKKADAQELIQQASHEMHTLHTITKDFPDIYHAGYIQNAEQEYVEANCLLNILNDEDLPDPDTLNISYGGYLLGLCDVVGELRRGALDSILEGNPDRANEYLEYMDSIYEAIMSFDYPSGLIPIKKKQDMVRNLIEKTRGELAVASCERRINGKTNEFRGLLDSLTESKQKKKKTSELDIDIDKVW